MVPISIVIAILIMALCFWQWQLRYQRFHTTKQIELAAVNISQEITAHIETRILALTRMAQRWEVRNGTPFAEWEADATNYVRDYAGYQALKWVDNQYCVQWAVPDSDDTLENRNLLLEEHRSVYEAARQSQDAKLTPTVTLPQCQGFLIYVPLFLKESKERSPNTQSNTQSNTDNYFDGFLVGVFDAQSLLDTIFNEKIKQEFAIEVFEGNNKIYRSSNIDFENRIENQWSRETEINFGNISWRVRVYPQPAYLKGEYSPISNMLSGGVVMPALLKWAIYLMKSSHKYARELEIKNSELISEITERKKIEVTLKQYVAEYEDLYNNAPCGYHSLDKSGNIVLINDTELKWLGYKREEVIGKNITKFFTAESVEKFRELFPLFLKCGEMQDYAFELIRSDGKLLPVLVNATAIKDAAGNFVMSRTTLFDIGDRQRAELEIRLLNAELEQRVIERTEELHDVNKQLRYKVTELERTQEALRESERQFRAIFNQTFQFIWLLAPDGTVLEANQTALEFGGLNRMEVIGTRLWEARLWTIDPNTQEQLQQAIEQASQGDFVRYSVDVIGIENKIITIDFSLKPVIDETGKVVLLIPEGRDITQRKRAEAELKQLNRELESRVERRNAALVKSEKKFRSLFESAPDFIYILNTQGIVERVNSVIVQQSGYSESELIGHYLGEFFTSDSAEIYNNQFSVLLSNSNTRREIEFICKDRKILTMDCSCSVVRDAQGNPEYILVLQRDISKRKQLDEELRNQNQALESAVVGISKLDARGNYLQVNPAYADLLGYQPEEITRTHWQQTVHPEDREKASKAYEKMLASQKAEIEVRAVRKDGSIFDKILVMVKAYDSKQEFSGHYGFMKDISERREIQRLKDEFISVVSHELRTPLTSIRGSLGLLAAGVLQAKPQQAQRMLQIAVNNSDRLIRLINDMLDIERIESGQVQMNKQICDTANLINSSVEVMRDIAQKTGITLSVNPVSASIWADCDRIIQVLTNLLSNAIKFSFPGSTVWLTAQIEEDKNRTPHILFQIRDEGRGIPKDKLESIFGRFQQVDASDSRQKGGTGLGLAICRSIIQQHSGFIWAQSCEDRGSTFYCKIPLLQEKESITAAIKTTCSNSSLELINDNILENQLKNQLENKNENQLTAQKITKVLIVEDDKDLAQVIISIFQRHGIETHYAKTGREAIQQSLHLLPDLMVLDLALPEVNGFDVVDSLRHHKRLCSMPLVVYTALDLNDKDRKRLQLGQTLLLTKARVTPEEFEQRTINLLERLVLSDKGE